MNKKWIGLGAAGGGALMLVLPMLTRRAMRITTILKKDHRLVSGLFMSLEVAGRADPKLRKAIFDQLKRALELHSQAEEEVFYTDFARIGFGDAHSRTEHRLRGDWHRHPDPRT